MSTRRAAAILFAVFAVAGAAASQAAADGGMGPLRPTVRQAVAADTSPALRTMQPIDRGADFAETVKPARPQGPVGDHSYDQDGALQSSVPAGNPGLTPPLFTFEGPSNEDNFRFFGFRVNPPDPDGDVGRKHYVAMVNLTFAIYSKTGAVLLPPTDTGTLWQGFAVEDCTDPSGDPIVVYDELADRWILTQFTTRFDTNQFYNCVAVSQTSDPLGPYHRFAFSSGSNFPDYPKYGVWPGGDSGGMVTITSRDFAPDDTETIGIYAIDREGLLEGDPRTKVVEFRLAGPPNLVGDGLLPADHDGRRKPEEDTQLLVGTQDDNGRDGATFDALNVFELDVRFDKPKKSSFFLKTQLPTEPFDSIYPCGVVPVVPLPPVAQRPTGRDCLPQPGVQGNQYLDILSYRQRPTWRLQYRNFGTHEALVTNQSVEARPSVAGVRWYEIRNPENPVIHQQGTFAPTDGVHRWMGSVALDKQGNLAAGYSVVNGTNVFPGIRYTGRLAGDPLGQLPQGERVLQAGTGVQTTLNSRWGDYTSMNVDPRDGCTFYYINEYYQRSGTTADGRPWQNRIGAFKFPGCH